MMSGIIDQKKGDMPKARDAYEKAVELNPNFVTAANNLAYIYSEEFKDYDKALNLAQKANQLAPDDPNVSDTLGWVLYRKGNPK